MRDEEGRPGSMFGLVEGERLGNVSYTKVLVGFDQVFINLLNDEYPTSFEEVSEGGRTRMTNSLDSREGSIIEKAIDSLNLFLDRYRTTFSYYWIRQLKPSEIAYFTITSVAEDGSEYGQGMMYAKDGLTPASTTLDSQKHMILQSRLSDHFPAPTTISLEMDARDKIDLREYKVAAILSATMFESFLKTSLQEIMEAEGKSQTEIEDAFRKSNNEYKSITRVAKDAHKTIHFDFENSDEYENWEDKTRDLRNDVVHEGYSPSEAEARESLNAASDAVDLLSEKMSDRIDEV